MATAPKIIIETIVATGITHTEAAAMFNVSDRWIRTLMNRYNTGGIDALTPRSTRPHHNPRATPPSTIERIITLRASLIDLGTDAGAQTISWHLHNENITPLPAVSTIHRILVRHGLVEPQPHKRPRSSWKRFQADQPNETWQLDYSDWELTRSRRVVILSILDDHSRFLLACEAFTGGTVINVIDLFTRAGQIHGYPQSMLTDNGRAFTTSTDRNEGGRNGFEQLLTELGVNRKNGKPYHPQTQGKVERFHQTLQRALRRRRPTESLEELNAQLVEIIGYYNHQRPHRAVNRRTPATAVSGAAQSAA